RASPTLRWTLTPTSPLLSLPLLNHTSQGRRLASRLLDYRILLGSILTRIPVSIGRSTVSSTASRACGPVLSTPMPIFCLQSRRKREAEFFQAEYLPVEMWRADRLLATWAPPSDQPYHEIECLRVSRGRHLAALVTSSLIDSTSDCTPHSLSSSAASAAPTWTRVADEPTITTPTTTTDYESTTVVATDAIEEEWARNVDALSRELDGWSTTSSSVVSPLSSDLSSIDLSFPTMTTACSLDAWDCETQNGEETDPPVPSKSMLRGVYEILAAIFCSRRKTKEEEEVKKVEIKMDRGYDGKR
ncbi:hypothetical protein PENTCL1PPCAC_30237, partial [Pristionchus entomophagus]